MIGTRTTFYAALLGAAYLTGCGPTGAFGSMSLLQGDAASEAPLVTSAELARGAITVSGPDGYCIDPATLRRTPSGGFAALASCHIMSGGQTGPIVEPALITVTVSPAPDEVPGPSDLAEVLGTTLLQDRELSALAVGLMATGGEAAFDGSDPRHWRGAFVIGPHLIGVTLYAPKDSPLVGAQGAAFVNTVSSTIRAKARTDTAARADQPQSSRDPLAERLGRLFARRDL
ncbi:MAG: dihydroxy-acid dehydratase [Marivita sp.]|uniref:dihydroxy-acid dehydratase n=1 Tax=Marivita sp. TaxID=2003365 RepID=UPI0025C39914|nr:dihydroxy-acid dehydratase [Marivita sp.]MCI5110644.1 dihydroxy-acid dehydratase [Marivita sp.]